MGIIYIYIYIGQNMGTLNRGQNMGTINVKDMKRTKHWNNI